MSYKHSPITMTPQRPYTKNGLKRLRPWVIVLIVATPIIVLLILRFLIKQEEGPDKVPPLPIPGEMGKKL
jgi:hypothetical protein